MFVSLGRIVYIVKKVASFWGLSKLMGVVHKITCARAMEDSVKLQLILIIVVYSRNSIKMTQESLASKYNKSSFRSLKEYFSFIKNLCT